ncbi:hypothetical protein IID24_05085 [Patescibacteria group bacterium]|nr:hypothetical protein [Patescibacteria group bacterium]
MRTIVDLGDQNQLQILAPDEGESPDGVPAWQILINGITSEDLHFLKGANFAAVRLWLQKALPNHIDRSVVDKMWPKINSALHDLSKEYAKKQLAEHATN